MREIVEEIPCPTAEELMKEMSPTHGQLWKGNRASLFTGRDWIFRGVQCASWGLCPSAFRGDAFARFRDAAAEPPELPDAPVPAHVTAEHQRHFEDDLVVRFSSEADKMGFAVPGDSAELRDSRFAIPDYDPHEFPPANKLHMYALAQHYGIPTRLLDWTAHSMVAAYFAVERIAKRRVGLVRDENASNEPCAIWALDRGFVEKMAREKILEPAIYVVTAPKATNPNLAAQGGLFTLVQPLTSDPQPLPNLDVVLRDNASKIPASSAEFFPLLIKFTLPAKEARVTLQLLEAENVHAGTVYPGLAGVVQKMRERKAYQWAEPHDRH